MIKKLALIFIRSFSYSLTTNQAYWTKYFCLIGLGVLCYKSEGRWFDSRWCHCNFSLT